MRRIPQANDADGHIVRKGDIVAPIRENFRARVCDIAIESDAEFVQLKPVHQPYSRAVWHAAEHVMWLAPAKR